MEFYKLEATILYSHRPNCDALTWGPYYFHNEENAIAFVPTVEKYISDWYQAEITPMLQTKRKATQVYSIEYKSEDCETPIKTKVLLEIKPLIFADEDDCR